MNSFSDPKFLAVASINYGYVPATLESPPSLYVTLKYPPPHDFQVDSMVRLHLRPGVGINTNTPGLNSVFMVNDIIGMNVTLKSITPNWRADLGNPRQIWGYDMRQADVRPLRQDWNYGYGTYQSFLEYHPEEW